METKIKKAKCYAIGSRDTKIKICLKISEMKTIINQLKSLKELTYNSIGNHSDH